MDYGLSSELPPDDDRQEHFKKQREERGWDDTELWSLDYTIAKFILPRLKVFKGQAGGFPANLVPEGAEGDDRDKGMEVWEGVIQEMIDAFEIIVQDKTNSKEEDAVVEKGLDQFRKHYFSLWN